MGVGIRGEVVNYVVVTAKPKKKRESSSFCGKYKYLSNTPRCRLGRGCTAAATFLVVSSRFSAAMEDVVLTDNPTIPT